MKILMTGATGFIGRALLLRLLYEKHVVFAAVRSVDSAVSALGNEVNLVDLSNNDIIIAKQVEGIDVVIHLAGENIFSKRWTAKRKRDSIESRLGLTQRLYRLVSLLEKKPKLFISASAVGYYGDSGQQEVDEGRGPGSCFLSKLCNKWEEASYHFKDFNTRVVQLRIGVVLGLEGGVILKMVPLFERGLGGTLGDGSHYVPWIHMWDLIRIISRSVSDESIAGPINAVAPNAVTNLVLTKTMAKILKRSANFPVPKMALKLFFGNASNVITLSQRVIPKKLEELGFDFRFPTIDDALKHILGSSGESPTISEFSKTENWEHLGKKPQYKLQQSIALGKERDEIFDFFSKAQNLGVLTPPWMKFQIKGIPKTGIKEGSEIDYNIKMGPISMKWKTVIGTWFPPEVFADIQAKGPYSLWHHEHQFKEEAGKTTMRDRVHYRLPVHALGKVAHFITVRGMLMRIFRYRTFMIHLRFNDI